LGLAPPWLRGEGAVVPLSSRSEGRVRVGHLNLLAVTSRDAFAVALAAARFALGQRRRYRRL
jgi:hypothetical protein